jgi:hypothetical protein
MDKFNWRFLFGILIVVAYFAIAYLVLFTTAFKGGMLNDTIRIIFGVVLSAYGIWRAYRLWKDSK